MSGRTIRTVVALIGGAVVLVAAAWLDTTVLLGIQHREAASFDATELAVAFPMARLASVGAIFALAILGWWSRSLLVGLVYVVVGAFFGFLMTLVWLFASSVNGAPPALPMPIADFLGQAYLQTESGPLTAVAIIGAGMLLVGLATVGLAFRSRASPVVREEAGAMDVIDMDTGDGLDA
ncbi:MAG: hypothetical protein ACHQNA_15040 [Acidimicrobiales bacterium]